MSTQGPPCCGPKLLSIPASELRTKLSQSPLFTPLTGSCQAHPGESPSSACWAPPQALPSSDCTLVPGHRSHPATSQSTGQLAGKDCLPVANTLSAAWRLLSGDLTHTQHFTHTQHTQPCAQSVFNQDPDRPGQSGVTGGHHDAAGRFELEEHLTTCGCCGRQPYHGLQGALQRRRPGLPRAELSCFLNAFSAMSTALTHTVQGKHGHHLLRTPPGRKGSKLPEPWPTPPPTGSKPSTGCSRTRMLLGLAGERFRHPRESLT